MNSKYTYIILKGEHNYIAIVPELPGVVTQSTTMDELDTRIKDAITTYLNTIKKEKLYTPDSLDFVKVGQVEIQ